MKEQRSYMKELKTVEEWRETFPVMKQLRSHLDENSYLTFIQEMVDKHEYKLIALYDGNRVVAVTGFMPMVTLYNGRFIWVCDLVTDSQLRSNGYGEILLNHVHKWSKENGYDIVSLSSGLQREGAHRFYESKMSYDKVSYVFLKRL